MSLLFSWPLATTWGTNTSAEVGEEHHKQEENCPVPASFRPDNPDPLSSGSGDHEKQFLLESRLGWFAVSQSLINDSRACNFSVAFFTF